MLNLAELDLCGLIPHAGDMCLLQRVEHYDNDSIVCVANSHKDLNNPLRSEGRLSAISGVEYAAQAMAIHGALTYDELVAASSGNTAVPTKGFLVSARAIKLTVDRLDDFADELYIHATRFAVIADAFSYEFSLCSAGHELMSGRLSVKVLIGE